MGEHDHEHNQEKCGLHHHHDRKITNKKRLILVILFNIIITAMEFAGGIASGSLALLSDAWHNLSDVFSLMLGYAGEKISEKERNKNYTFGLKRFEVLIAFINAVSLIGVGAFIVYEAVERFKYPVEIEVSIMISVAIIGLLGNAFSILVLSKNRDDNLNMKSAFLHLLYDTISSLAVIGAGIIIYFTHFFWIDLIISFIIAVMIVISSMNIIRASLRIFLQGTPSHINLDYVYTSINSIEDVEGVHGLHIWSVSSDEVFLSCHINICRGENISGDVLIVKIKEMLKADYDISHTTLQVEHNKICKDESGNCCNT